MMIDNSHSFDTSPLGAGLFIHKSHNVSILLYHLVFPAKYRRAVLDRIVDEKVRDVCLEIEKCYELKFLEIDSDKDHMHFLVQSVPQNSVTQLVTLIKSLTARWVLVRCPDVKKQLWGGEFWSDGYFASTVTQLLQVLVGTTATNGQGHPP